MKKIYAFLALAVAIGFTSCKDDKEDVKPTKTILLTNKKWVVTADAVTTGSNTTDLYANYDACDKDDFVKFTSDGKVTFDEGPNKCDSTATQTQTYNWSFINNESGISITDGTNTLTKNISELSASKLVLTSTETDTINGNVVTYNFTTTYGAQ